MKDSLELFSKRVALLYSSLTFGWYLRLSCTGIPLLTTMLPVASGQIAGCPAWMANDLNDIQPCVKTSRDTLPCSATLGKIAALQKEVIVGSPGSSNKQEVV